MNPKSKILIVDDSREDRELLKEILEQAGSAYEVWTVNSGKLALALIEQDPPDLILLDIQMAETNGFETLTEMRKRGKMIPVLLVSAFTNEEDRSKGIACGATDFIDKPLIAEAVRARVAVQIKMNKLQEKTAWGIPRKGMLSSALKAESPAQGRPVTSKIPSLADIIKEMKGCLVASQEALSQIPDGKVEINGEVKNRLHIIETNINQLLKFLEDVVEK